MTEKEILNHIKADNINLMLFDSVGSTNDLLREMAKKDKPEGTVVIANEQTAGKGRRGRNFFSPSGSGIYMSILLRPQMQVSDSLYVTTAAAVAVSRAIEKVCGVKTSIKWVNDIYIDDRKVCGILAEAATVPKSPMAQYIILGIGVNLYLPKNGFPSEISSIASSVIKENRKDEEQRAKLAAQIINDFFEIYPSLSNDEIFSEYKSKLFLLGKKVRVISGTEEYEAEVLDIDSEYRLCVKKQDGTTTFLDSGEVSTKIS